MVQLLITAVYAVLVAFALSVVLCPIFIPYLTKLKFGQNVRSDGPKTHLKKTGTPTMGGIVIVISLVISALFFIDGNRDALVVLMVTTAFAVIGFADDYIKVVKKRSLGLRAYQKLIAQFIVIGLFIAYLYYAKIDLKIYIPFTNGYFLDLGFLTIPFIVFFITGFVNGVNLTDGLDGLASGVTVLVVTFFLFVSFAARSPLLPLNGAAVGALLGFLLFNSYPAKVIMGDTGSLALGGLVASIAIFLRMPVLLCMVGLIYVIESFSVIIQVSYFKLTKGKRFFKMAPIHHHFELLGWPETKVVTLFYIVTAVMCLIGFLATRTIY